MNHKTIMEFHGGLDTIGGNIISLVYNGYRIITDFGAVVGVDINELAYQKNTQVLYDDNKLPKIDGLFRQEALEDNSTSSFGPCGELGSFTSGNSCLCNRDSGCFISFVEQARISTGLSSELDTSKTR